MDSPTDPSDSANGTPLKYKIGVSFAIVFLIFCAVGIDRRINNVSSNNSEERANSKSSEEQANNRSSEFRTPRLWNSNVNEIQAEFTTLA
ncbi:hypothetical protein RB195_009363 [Necator americanus]|uniref:Uncharacterized protein n=1 Tax=Necator americanus TaxID=51031 RepID=A0ABR1CT02_NECAM